MICPNCQHEWKTERKKRVPKETDPRIKQLVEHYINGFELRFGNKPMVNWGACGMMLKRILLTHEQNVIADYIDSYLKCDDKFFNEAGLMLTLLPLYVQKQSVKPKFDMVKYAERVVTPSWKSGVGA